MLWNGTCSCIGNLLKVSCQCTWLHPPKYHKLLAIRLSHVHPQVAFPWSHLMGNCLGLLPPCPTFPCSFIVAASPDLFSTSLRKGVCPAHLGSWFFVMSLPGAACWVPHHTTFNNGFTGYRGFPGGSVVKNLLASSRDTGDLGSIPELGRSPAEGNGSSLRYSCLENPMDRGAWWATVHGVTKSLTWLSSCTSHQRMNPPHLPKARLMNKEGNLQK